MRVLIVSNLYGRLARGGAERVVEIEAAGLRERGHEVAVVSGVPSVGRKSGVTGIGHEVGSDGTELFTYFPPNTCFYTELSGRSWLGRLIWHWLDIFNWRSANILARLVTDWRPDIVHTHNLMGLGFAIPAKLRQSGIRHVHTVHDVQLLHPSGLLPSGWTGPRWLHERAYIWLMRQMMGSPETVPWPSEFVRDLHLRFGFFPHSRQVLLRNPVSAVRSTGERRIGTPRTFLFVGQLEEHKGILDLVMAWSQWTDRGDAKLVVVGDGSLESEVRRISAGDPSVECRGRLRPEDLANEFAAADWLVVPSRVIENAPTVIVEALACGLPVMAARTGGIPELVRDGENGLLFEPGDAVALEEALVSTEGLSLTVQPSVDPSMDEFLDSLGHVLFGK